MGMSLVFLSLAIAALWINLLGAGLAAQRFVGDYVISRAAGVLAACLCFFFVEHFAGLGARLPLLPFTTALSLWLMWRGRPLLRENWRNEALFGAGDSKAVIVSTTVRNLVTLRQSPDYFAGTEYELPIV